MGWERGTSAPLRLAAQPSCVRMCPRSFCCPSPAGPVGLLCAFWARYRGAARIICIDSVPERLAMAQKHIGAEIVNRAEVDVVKTVQGMMPGGCDVAIDATGFRYAQGMLHKAARLVGLESDTCEQVNECITLTRKCGRISLIADYFGLTNGFNLGAFMEKSITMRGGQLFAQKHAPTILRLFEEGRVEPPMWIVTHHMRFEEAAQAYQLFDSKRDGVVKIVLHTQASGYAFPDAKAGDGGKPDVATARAGAGAGSGLADAGTRSDGAKASGGVPPSSAGMVVGGPSTAT